MERNKAVRGDEGSSSSLISAKSSYKLCLLAEDYVCIRLYCYYTKDILEQITSENVFAHISIP